MDVKKVLHDAGFAGNEAKVYLALLDLGSATAGDVAKASGVNRTNVYDAIRSLSAKGLVGFIKKAERRYFEAASPYKIVHYLEEREEDIRSRRELVENVAPDLEMKRTLAREEHDAMVYHGRKGLKTIAEDVLRNGTELLVFGADGEFTRIFRTYSRNWHMRRANKRIRMKIIYSENAREEKSKEAIDFCDMRFSRTIYSTPSTTWVYGDTVAIIVWSDSPIATLIRSERVARSYRAFFREMWRSSRGRAL
jgi:sugar-specific transcriptional regulator TrmB